MSHSPRTCSTCQHWQRQDAGRMNQHGMHPCAHGRIWTYLPPQHTCQRWARPTRATSATTKENM